MAQLDYGIGQARTPLNIQPGIQNYFTGQANRRANIASEATQKAAKKQQTIADMVSRNTDETGKLNRDGLTSGLMRKGMLSTVTKIKSDFAKQDAAIVKAEDDKRKRDGEILGRLAEGFKFSPDDYESKERAMDDFLYGVRKAGMQIHPSLLEAEVGEEQIEVMDRLFNEFGTEDAKKRLSGKGQVAKGKASRFTSGGLQWSYDPNTNAAIPIMDPTTGKQMTADQKPDPLDLTRGKERIKESFAKRKEQRAKKAKLDEWARKKALGGSYKSPQYTAANYGLRMNKAREDMDRLYSKGYKRQTTGQRIFSILPGEFSSDERKQQDQAERNFINANLRLESGAAIADTEFASAELQYFPRPGDTEKVLRQKEANRISAIAALKAEAGGAWGEVVRETQGLTPQKRVGKWKKRDTAKSFSSAEAADAANLPSGTIITINGRRARVK